MSKRRNPGEICKRKPGSGFLSSPEPELVKVPDGKAFEFPWKLAEDGRTWITNAGGEKEYCMMNCGDEDCKEFANLEIANGPNAGEFLYHISECQLDDMVAV